MNLWNIKDLEAPPVTTYKSPFFIELIHLQDHFKTAVEYFSNQAILEKEAALLSRCIYRMKMKFRSDTGFKAMEKLNRALLQFNYLKFHVKLEDFLSLLPEDKSEQLYAPTRNTLDYILVRLQGLTCLMHRIMEMAQIAADSMGSRICIGQFWKVAAIILGLVSRIWFISKDIIKYSCEFYRDIKQLRNSLKNIGNDWLPSTYVFPESLEGWLNIHWLNIKESQTPNIIESKIPILDITDSSDVEECGEYIEVKDEKDEIIDLIDGNCNSKGNKDIIKIPNMFELLMQEEDLGEVVCHSSVKIGNNQVHSSSDSEIDFQPNSDNFNHSKKKKKNQVRNLQTSNMKRDGSLQISNKKAKYNNGSLKEKKSDISRLDRINIEDDQNNHPVLELKKAKKGNKQVKFTKLDQIEKNKLKNGKLVKKRKKKKQSSQDEIDNINSLSDVKRFLIYVNQPNLLRGYSDMDVQTFGKVKKRIRKITKQVDKNLISEADSLLNIKNLLRMNLIKK